MFFGLDLEADRANADERVAQILGEIGDEVMRIGGERPVGPRQAGMHFGHGVDACRSGNELVATLSGALRACNCSSEAAIWKLFITR